MVLSGVGNVQIVNQMTIPSRRQFSPNVEYMKRCGIKNNKLSKYYKMNYKERKMENTTEASKVIDYKKEYYRLQQEVAAMLVENRRNYKNPMTPFELLSRWDKIRELK